MSQSQSQTHTIHRHQYTAPAYLINKVHLTFDLDANLTLVTSVLNIRRAPSTNKSTPLFLNGQDLQLKAIYVDNQIYSALKKEDGLEIYDLPDECEIRIINTCCPNSNTSLMGLYASKNNLLTQCEAEGFRKITYFIDRPDVMTVYTVTLKGDLKDYPVLLSNGNLIEEKQLADGFHSATWHDPFPKPSYLFALVAGKFKVFEKTIHNIKGESKLLQIWVEAQDLNKVQHAMDSLIHSIQWDEQRFGLALDLDRFMIVAANDFNMGAMENKGLNIFNTKYVLANPNIATDQDFTHVESVIAHEYFHNWTGNRITCRDWFQLSLKEGLTVFRDQEFSADQLAKQSVDPDSAYAVKRIEDVRFLKQVQFAEDAGPMAHPIRPESYEEINNFYTVTVYEKGAEVVRMLQTLLGKTGFRLGIDHYFKLYDGQAVTCDDFLHAMGEANHYDLHLFSNWYSHVGTPRVKVTTQYDAINKQYKISLTQILSSNTLAPTNSALQENKKQQPLFIPFAIGLINGDGTACPLNIFSNKRAEKNETTHIDEKQIAYTQVLKLTNFEQTFIFENIEWKNNETQNFAETDQPKQINQTKQNNLYQSIKAPVPSLLRNFSAPVIVEYDYSDEELCFIVQNDTDAYNRWDAMQNLFVKLISHIVSKPNFLDTYDLSLIKQALSNILNNHSLAPAFRELILTLPNENFLAEKIKPINPQAIYQAVKSLTAILAKTFEENWRNIYFTYRVMDDYEYNAEKMGRRALSNLALHYLSKTNNEEIISLAVSQFNFANNITDRLAVLKILIKLDNEKADMALEKFYHEYMDEPLAIDKWFAIQALQPGQDQNKTIDIVRNLVKHPNFNYQNPNRARSLLFNFCGNNLAAFHLSDGSGYQFWQEQVIILDAINPQSAARLVRVLENWRHYIPALQEKMLAALHAVSKHVQSKDVREIINRTIN